MARTLFVLLVLCGAGCSTPAKTTVVSRFTVEPNLPHTHTSYRPDVKAKLEVELKREF